LHFRSSAFIFKFLVAKPKGHFQKKL